MKKIIILAFAGLLIAPAGMAQTVSITPYEPFSRHEVTVGTGALTTDQIMSATFDLMVTLLSFASYTELDKTYSAPLTIGYKYRFNRIFSLGGTFSHSSSHGDCNFLYDTDADGAPKRLGTVRTNFNLFAAELDVRYLTGKWASLYSTLGFGFTAGARNVTPNDPASEKTRMPFFYPNFQVTALGLKVGHDHFGGYLDIGAGYKGIFAVGLYGRF